MTESKQEAPAPKKPSVHLTLQEKGGVGKSVLASILAQKLQGDGKRVKVLDCDPYNASLYRIKALGAEYIKILDENRKFLPEAFDEMMMKVLEGDYDSYIIDNGAAAYMQLSKYMFDDNIIGELVDNGFEVYIHSVITAGGEQDLVLENFDQICEGFGDVGAKIVLWENQFLGPIKKGDKRLEDFAVYKKHKKKLFAHITTPELNEHQMPTMEKMLNTKITFDEVQTSDEFHTLQKSRLRKLQKQYFDLIDAFEF